MSTVRPVTSPDSISRCEAAACASGRFRTVPTGNVPSATSASTVAISSLVTAANCYSLVMLCHFLLRGGQASGHALIGSGAVLWITNVLLFGVWFWQLDSGGPLARARRRQPHPDFLFVQMTERKFAPPDWEPTLLDYLYTSFTNATAFSPTDTMPLTPMAKFLMAAQSLIALVTIGLVVARAVNILS